MTGLENMLSSLTIRIEENIFKDVLVAESSQHRSYCEAIVDEIEEVLNEQMQKMKMKIVKKQEEVMKKFKEFFNSVLS